MSVGSATSANFAESEPCFLVENLCELLSQSAANPAGKTLMRDAIVRKRQRRSIARVLLIGLVCLLGLGSRRFSAYLPAVIATYAGDTLWALAAFFALGMVFNRASTWVVGAIALAFSVCIELSQLYHAPWIDSIRHIKVGGLILGYDFVWSDLACYAVGVGVGVLIEWSTVARPVGSVT